MTTIDENIKKLSKIMIAAGFIKYTEEYIHSQVKGMIDSGDATNKTKALALFKSNPEVKRALSLGDLQEAQFDVIGLRDNESRSDASLKVQEAFLVLSKNNKPELRTSSIWYSASGTSDQTPAPIQKGKSYKAKINMSKGMRVFLPAEESAYETLDSPLFTPEQLKQYVAVPVEELVQGSTGMVWGTIGKKTDKKLEISTDASLLPLNIFPDENVDVSDLIEGDTVIACGYYSKAGLGARYITRVKEQEPELPKLGKL